MAKENRSLFTWLLILSFTLVCLTNEGLLNIFGAIVSIFTQGASEGKTYAFLFYVNLCFFMFYLKSKFAKGKYPERRARTWMNVFLGFVLLGWALGLLQFYCIVSGDFPIYPYTLSSIYYATYSDENWEASHIRHNHFPKAMLYFATRLLDMDLPKTVDNGYPMYTIIPDRELWSTAFLLVEIIALASLIMHIRYVKNPSLFDSLLLVTGTAGILVSIIDGGFFSSAARTSFPVLLLYLIRTRFEGNVRSTAQLGIPFLAILIFQYIGTMINITDVGAVPAAPFLLAVLGIFIDKARKTKKDIETLVVFSLLFAGILIGLWNMYMSPEYQHKMYGSQLGLQTHLTIYGLPQNVSEDDVRSALCDMPAVREIKNIYKVGWFASAVAETDPGYNSKYIENGLKERFESDTYLYVAADPLTTLKTNELYIFWKGKKPEDISKSMNITIGSTEIAVKEGTEQPTIIKVRSYASSYYPALAVLSLLDEKGAKQCVVVGFF